VGGPGCDFRKTQGLFNKSARRRLKGWIWSIGSRSNSRGSTRAGVLGLTGTLGFDWKACHDLDRRMHIGRLRSSVGGRDGGSGALRRRAAAQDGELAGAAVHKKRRERHQNDQERMANPTAGTRRGDGEARRRSSSEDGPAARCTSAQTSDTCGSLTERRFHRAAPTRRTGGGGTSQRRRRRGMATVLTARVWGGSYRR
jgi:hypothetical protein